LLSTQSGNFWIHPRMYMNDMIRKWRLTSRSGMTMKRNFRHFTV